MGSVSSICLLPSLVSEAILWYALVLLGKSGFPGVYLFRFLILGLFVSLDVRGRLFIFRLSFTSCFSSLIFRGFIYSTQASILSNVRGRLFNYSAFPLHLDHNTCPAWFLLLFLSPKFYGIISPFQPWYTAFLGPMPA